MDVVVDAQPDFLNDGLKRRVLRGALIVSGWQLPQAGSTLKTEHSYDSCTLHPSK
jgi:hypothetical protein